VAEISTLEQLAWIWCICFAFLLPEVGTLIRSMRIVWFKSVRRGTFSDFFVVLCFEAMHVIGLSLLMFVVLPELDVVKGAMLTNCVAFIPAVFGLMSRNNKESRRLIKVIVDLVAIGAQATGFFIWPIVEIGRGHTKTWTVPVAIFLVSAGWWENYVDRRSPISPIKKLGRLKDRLKKTRYWTYLWVSISKILIFMASTMLFLHLNGVAVGNIFSKGQISAAFNPHPINVTQMNHYGGTGFGVLPDIPGGANYLREIIEVRSHAATPIYVLLIHIISAYLAYVIGKFACKIVIQGK
jgi:chitin synthase